MKYEDKKILSYIIGVALGDGNLSNPNGRAIRLRITCDTKYTRVTEEIISNLQILLPNNKISIIQRKPTFLDISVYSNKFAAWLPWKVGLGPKHVQEAHVPQWIFSKPIFVKSCLRGLLQTDGSVYVDRGYTMVNFTNACKPLAADVALMLSKLGYKSSFGTTGKKYVKHTVRVTRDSKSLLKELALRKM